MGTHDCDMCHMHFEDCKCDELTNEQIVEELYDLWEQIRLLWEELRGEK